MAAQPRGRPFGQRCNDQLMDALAESGPAQDAAAGISPSAPDALDGRNAGVVRGILKNASATALLQGGSLIMGFLTAVLLARFLGGSGYGQYVFALAWANLLAIPAILGFDRFLVRGIAVYDVERNLPRMRGLLRRTNQFVLLISAVIVASGWTVAQLLLGSSMRAPFVVAMLVIPITALTLLRQGAMQALGRIVSGQLPEYLIRPALILLGICALQFGGSDLLTSTTALGVNVLALMVAFVVGAIVLNRALPSGVRSVRAEYATREWLTASLPMMLISGIWMANNYCTTLVVGTLDGSRAVGVYNVVQKGAELIVLVLLAANMALAPTLARLYARRDRDGLEHTTERIAQAALAVSAPLAAGFIIFGGAYLSIFGASFKTGATALTILAVGQLFNATAGPAGNVLLMTGHERNAVAGIVIGLAANLILAVILVPPLGVTGGAIAFATSLVLWNSALVIIARRRVAINVTAIPRLAMRTRR
jgi:O-antigen/teichoic acid export membrane protein